MPLPAYGVVVGTLSHVTRDEPTPAGLWSRSILHLDTPSGQFTGTVDSTTLDGVRSQYRVVRHLNHRALAPILRLPAGWQPLASTRSSGALDYVRSPLFGAGLASRYFGFWLFRRDSLIGRFLRWLEGLQTPWIDSSGDTALNALETQLLGSVRVFVFGAPAPTGLGIHDIHLNQGDPLGQFQPQDGIWQDGGVLIERPSGEIVAFLTKFASQSLHTNSHGLPI